MLNKQTLISIEDALPGREQPMQIEDCHFVNQSSLTAPLAHHQQQRFTRTLKSSKKLLKNQSFSINKH